MSLSTKINQQKSFWRLKFNIDAGGVTINEAVVVKMRKLYNNLKKAITLNLYRAFLMIDKHSQSVQAGYFIQPHASGIDVEHE